MKQILDAKGIDPCLKEIAAETNDVARNQIFRFMIRKLGGGSGATPADLDAMVTIGKAAIENAVETSWHQVEQAPLWIDEANVSAFNLSANLCDCWGDGDSRERRHFEAGLLFADQALRFRQELKKGPGPFSMAHWARGKHLLSLGQAEEAAHAFTASLLAEQDLAKASGLDPQPSKDSPGTLLLAYGFLGLAKIRSDSPDGQVIWEAAHTFLKAQVEAGEGDARDEAKSYLDQLAESVRRRG